MDEATIDELARRLAKARADRAAAAPLSREFPELAVATAYRIQRRQLPHTGPLAGWNVGFAASLQHDGGDHELRLRHGRPPTLVRCQLCRETTVNYVLKSHTVSPTKENGF
jgi:hypothetical protein